MLMALVLVAVVVFVAGLIHGLFFYFPTKKSLAWVQSLLKMRKTTSQQVVLVDSAVMDDKNNGKRILTTRDKAELKSVFSTFDKNNDGFITKKELEESLKNIGIYVEEREVADMVEKVDSNGDGLIDIDEFCELFGSLVGQEEEEEVVEEEEEEGAGGREDVLKEAFDVFDEDGDGLITVEELGVVLSSLGLKEGKRLESCKEMIKKVDMDGDGMINFDEFKQMMKAGGTRLVAVS